MEEGRDKSSKSIKPIRPNLVKPHQQESSPPLKHNQRSLLISWHCFPLLAKALIPVMLGEGPNTGKGALTSSSGSSGRSTPEAGSRSDVLLAGTWWCGGMPKKGHGGEYRSTASYTRVGGRGRTHELSGLVPLELAGLVRLQGAAFSRSCCRHAMPAAYISFCSSHYLQLSDSPGGGANNELPGACGFVPHPVR